MTGKAGHFSYCLVSVNIHAGHPPFARPVYPMLEFETEGHADRVTALPINREGGKSGLLWAGCWVTPRSRYRFYEPESGTESGTETYRPSRMGRIRVKSDGKSVRPSAVTQRRLNPTWSKAK